jgi:glycosyltransferase involved in cell wall biosynthesis
MSQSTPAMLSFVIPVYNKADILPRVAEALARQTVADDCEFVFVDDASTDDSAAVLCQLAERLGRCRVIGNATNAGPSIRLNQGVAAARGETLALIDADVLIAPDTAERMLVAMAEYRAPMIHGRTVAAPDGALPAPLGRPLACSVGDRPLATVLQGGFARMGWLVRTELFRAAGGCDERVFIQDESLPLRLALKADRLAHTAEAIAHAPPAAFRLSHDRRQQHHDLFFTHYNLLRDHPDLPGGLRRKLAARCLSAAWKAVRGGSLDAGRASTLADYMLARCGLAGTAAARLDRLAAAFRRMTAIRRPT